MSVFKRLRDIATRERLEADGCPSASIALLEDGKITSHMISVHGTEDTDTVYQAASISKAITGLAVAKLVDDGKLTYDTKVVEHLPDTLTESIVQPETAHLMQHVTVGMLLSHTSGLSGHGWFGYASNVPSAEAILAGQPPASNLRIRFDSFPGAQHSYSGGGYLVLHLFLESLTGKDFATLMQDTLLRPLSMTRSHFGVVGKDEKNYATAHYTADVEAEAPYHKYPELASGALWTTPTDLLKAISAVQVSLESSGGFLTPDTAKNMITFQPATNDTWGLGWGLDDSVFAHGGFNYPGYKSYTFGSHGGLVNAGSHQDGKDWKPKVPRGCGVAIMTNSVVGDNTYRKVISAIFHMKGWPRFASLPSYIVEDDEYYPYALAESGVVDDDACDWIGKWEGGWELTESSGRLKLAFSKILLRD